jgi:CheY-like chemotaxis protein
MSPGKNLPAEDRKTILVVDDDQHVLKFVSTLLIQHHYDVLNANSGPEALQLAKENPAKIDLLLSDFQMPGMSGVELATALSNVRPEIKVLLMSGFPDGMLVLNEGWHFLAKPFIASQLCALVAGLVQTPLKANLR